jgi:hypothetical protein
MPPIVALHALMSIILLIAPLKNTYGTGLALRMQSVGISPAHTEKSRQSMNIGKVGRGHVVRDHTLRNAINLSQLSASFEGRSRINEKANRKGGVRRKRALSVGARHWAAQTGIHNERHSFLGQRREHLPGLAVIQNPIPQLRPLTLQWGAWQICRIR